MAEVSRAESREVDRDPPRRKAEPKRDEGREVAREERPRSADKGQKVDAEA